MSARPGPPDDGRVRAVFSGSGSFAVPVLERLAADPRIRLVAVVTAPPKRAGRQQAFAITPVDAYARANDLHPILTPPKLRHPEAIEAILALRPELAVLADYGQIVPPALLDLRHGALNLHPSALPRFRGAAPVPAAILAGDASTAVALMRMDEGLDTGPIVARSEVPLAGTETAPELELRLAGVAADLLEGSLGPWLAGTLAAVPQSVDGVVLTRPLRREDGRLDPSRPAAELERTVRAYRPWPGTFVDLPDGRLVVTSASVAPSGPDDVPGAIVREGGIPPLQRPMAGSSCTRSSRRAAERCWARLGSMAGGRRDPCQNP